MSNKFQTFSKQKSSHQIQNDMSSDDDISNEEHEYEFESDDQQSSDNQSEGEIQRKRKQLLEMEERQIKAQLKDIPFGELVKYRKLKQEVNKEITKQIKKDRSKREILNKDKKFEKGAAREIKIMKRPPKMKFKPIFQSDKPKSIDPRFQQYAGHYNAGLATQTYSFIKDIQRNQVDYLKKQLKNKKVKEQQREILLKNYNKITNDMKRFENQQLQKQVKSQYKGKNFVPKRRQLKQQVQRKKLDTMDAKDQDKRLKKKEKKIQKQRMIERKQFMSRNKNIGK